MKIGTKRLLLALTICLLCAVLVVAFVACDDKTVPSGPPSGFDDDPWTDAEIESAFELTHSTDGYTISKYIGSETELTLPKKYKGEPIIEIGSSAFKKCDALTEVTIPDSVKSISSSAFEGCTGLQTVTIGDGVTSIGVRAFDSCKGLQTVTIGDGVTSIGNLAFYFCIKLQTVTTGENVKSIGDAAFVGCSGLQSVTIGSGVQSIGDDAFGGCTGITKVNYLGDLKGWCEIECGSYSVPLYSAKNAKLYLNDVEVKGDVHIPAGTSKIGRYAFCRLTGITSITIPDSVTNIGEYTFSGCTGLQTVYYGGTSAQWNEISIGSDNNYLKNAQRYYFSEQPNYDGEHWHWNGNHTAPEVWENTSQAAAQSIALDERKIVDVWKKQN